MYIFQYFCSMQLLWWKIWSCRNLDLLFWCMVKAWGLRVIDLTRQRFDSIWCSVFNSFIRCGTYYVLSHFVCLVLSIVYTNMMPLCVRCRSFHSNEDILLKCIPVWQYILYIFHIIRFNFRTICVVFCTFLPRI